MNIAKHLFGLAGAALAVSGHAAILTENFDDLASSGWVLTNNSVPADLTWFQGNEGVFASQAGASGAYAAANFNSAALGTGVIDNWLISPEFAVGAGSTLSFFTRSEAIAGFNDSVQVLFNAGSSSATASFTTLLATIGPASYPGDWTEFSIVLPTAITGRIAFRYTVADALTANYVGVDTVNVSAVPEPTTYALMALGLAGLGLLRRGRTAA